KGREQTGQEDRGERRVVEDDVSFVLVGEEAAEGRHREEDLRRDEEAGIDRAFGRHECVREEEEVDQRAELEEPEEDREVLGHRRVASRAYMHSRTSALCRAGLSLPYLVCTGASVTEDIRTLHLGDEKNWRR